MMKYLILINISILIFSCTPQKKEVVSKSFFIPNDAQLVVKTNDFTKLQSQIDNNSLYQKNDKHSIVDYFKSNLFLNQFNLENQSFYLCFSPIGKEDIGLTLVTEFASKIAFIENIAQTEAINLEYNNQSYKQYQLGEQSIFTSNLGDYWIASEHKLLIENCIRQFQSKTEIDPILSKNLSLLDDQKSSSIVFNNKNFNDFDQRLFPNSKSSVNKFSGWTVGDLSIENDQINFDGIYKNKDSIFDYVALFNNVESNKNRLVEITPTKAVQLSSITFNDYKTITKNIANYNSKITQLKPDSLDVFFREFEEIGSLKINDEELVASRLINQEIEIEDFVNVDSKETYREFNIYSLNGISFKNKFAPLVYTNSYKYVAKIKEFLIFGNTVNTLKEIIVAKQNNETYHKTNWYEDLKESITSKSNYLHFSKTPFITNQLSKIVKSEFSESWKTTTTKDYPVGVLQINKESDFAHIQISTKKLKASKKENQAHLVATTFLKNNIIGNPQFVKNHTNKTHDVVVQDEQNILYLLSNSGTITWQKQLNEPIIGKIDQIDIYRNGRLQLIFTTASGLHVLDRNGKEVAPFPIKFKDQVTQPVAVFDYDNNRKYRIAVVQNNQILLYDTKGKLVKGFNYPKKGTLSTPPKHIRVGTKDYIVVNEAEKGVHILNRKGEERIKIKSKPGFTTNEWYWHKSAFTTLTNDQLITQINTKGEVNKMKPKNDEGEISIVATPLTLVSFSENILYIKDKKVELEFGIYTEPQIFYVNQKVYVAITDTQNHQVHVFDSNGDPIPGFPVFGNSVIDIENIDKDANLELITKGDANSVIFYEM